MEADASGLIDLDTGSVRGGRLLAQRTPVAMLVLGFGPVAGRLGRFTLGDESEDSDPFISECRRVADDIERRKPAMTDVAEDRLLRRIAIVETLSKAGYDPDQPRAPAGGPDGGEWVSDQDMDAGGFENAALQAEDVHAKKERFVDAHLVDAQKVADELGVPVENVLGLSALESKWGGGRFAVQGNNYMSIYYPAPYAVGYILSAEPPQKKLAKFASYADCLSSFVEKYGSLVRGKGEPEAFAAALQDAGKYGIETKTGAKVPTFVKDVAGTIRGLRSIVSRRKV